MTTRLIGETLCTSYNRALRLGYGTIIIRTDWSTGLYTFREVASMGGIVYNKAGLFWAIYRLYLASGLQSA